MRNENGKKFFLLSLGCPKNLVDSEKISLNLMKLGLTPTPFPQDADLLIVNTCGFIRSARRMSEYYIKKLKNHRAKLLITGCYPRRIGKEKLKRHTELVTEGPDETIEFVGELFSAGKQRAYENVRRLNSLSRFSAYLKTSEGCSRSCSFCSIPKIRGPVRSIEENTLVDEARYLAENGVREIIVISQDTTMWNVDRGGKREDLFRLLDRLSEIPQIEWIRLLYVYPDRFALRLIDYMAENPKIVRYIQMPFQHIDDEILRNMARATTEKLIHQLLERIHTKLPDAAIRTEIIVGFPGETNKKFEKLLNFIESYAFDWLGVFEFSPENGTPAYNLWKQKPIPQREIKKRKELVKKIWTKILLRKQRDRIGRVFKGIYDSEGKYRAYFQAPEVDGVIRVISSKNPPAPFENIRVESFEMENLIGSIV